MTFNVYSEFQPLEKLVIGRGYPADYFDFIPDSQVRDQLQQIFGEIEQDFQNLQRTVESFGVSVYRPNIVTKSYFQNRARSGWHDMPPITPRDRQVVLGQQFVSFSDNPGMDAMYSLAKQLDAAHVMTDPSGSMIGANASCIFKMGRDIWFDESQWLTALQSQWLIDHVLDSDRYRFHRMVTNGHSDCVFQVLRPGVILTTFHDAGLDYSKEFPGWQTLHLDCPSIQKFNQFRDLCHPGLTWWVPDRDNLPRFSQYVDQYLNHWVGAINETVFDINCLSLDTEHVIFACYNQEVFDFCRSHGIEPILCELRHRFFFDGGIHCVTLDLARKGSLEDYF